MSDIEDTSRVMGCVMFHVHGKYCIELTPDGNSVRASETLEKGLEYLREACYRSGIGGLLFSSQFQPRVLEASMDELLAVIGDEYQVADLNGAVYRTCAVMLPDEAGQKFYERAVDPFAKKGG